MKRKLLCTTLIVALMLSGCGGSESTAPTNPPTPETIEASAENEPIIASEEKADLSEINALGSIEVNEQIFDVEITIPKDFVGESTQSDLDKTCEEYGYKSITLNADGSATYVMTKEQHKELLQETKSGMNTSLSELIGSEEYPNFTKIEANDNFTEFTITTKSSELDMAESFSVIMFYMYGGMYGIFSGEEVDNISVSFVNADTGEVIETANSSDME